MNQNNRRKTKNARSVPQRKLKVAIYIRVSTHHQIDKDSLPMQKKDLVTYASLILGIDDYVIFEDAGYSGKNTDRPDYQEMMKRVRKGEFTHLLVWKIDRISRNLLDFVEMYEELRELRVTFVSKNEQFQTDSAMGEAMLKIILVFAELERNMASERVTATMISRASSGLWNGGRIPFGYNYNPEISEFSVREDEKAVCCLIRDDYLKHKSLVHTSRILNEAGYKTRAGADWSPTSVWIIVSSPFYAGIYRYNRYKGTENRTVNPEEEWVLIYDHHPAIFTLEEHELLLGILAENARHCNAVGQKHMGTNIHIFSGIAYCGKCGSKMQSTPGKLHANGYRPSNYSCPKHRKSKECDNPTMNDTVLGEFVLNYILNILNAKTSFSTINSPEELESRLLFGNTFSNVDSVEENGLHELYNLLSRYGSDKSYTFSLKAPKKKKAAVDPEVESLRKEKEKQERALKRLQDLFLFSDEAISEKDFILRKSEILQRISEINIKLGMVAKEINDSISDEDFIKQASHLLISKQLSGRKYIYFKNLAQSVSPEILKTYMETILDSVQLADSRVISITFKNGLTHRFIYRNLE